MPDRNVHLGFPPISIESTVSLRDVSRWEGQDHGLGIIGRLGQDSSLAPAMRHDVHILLVPDNGYWLLWDNIDILKVACPTTRGPVTKLSPSIFFRRPRAPISPKREDEEAAGTRVGAVCRVGRESAVIVEAAHPGRGFCGGL